MTTQNDLFQHGIAQWAASVRQGSTSFSATLEHCIEQHGNNTQLNAFECVDSERARATAHAMDTLLASGTDLGPLMGLPIGIKDIMAVSELPTSNGSNADTAHLTGAQGQVVSALRAAGAIVFGKTKTVEFALGATGVNEARGTPWNPVDRQTHRIPGGSSSGSAVAVSAGLVGLALGTDTGGSIRIPACFTGIVGHKTTVGRWPKDGIFPLSPTLDSVGPLVRCIADAAIMHTLITGEPVGQPRSLVGLRFGVPQTLFMDDLDDQVAQDFERACDALVRAGAIRYDIDFPEALEREYLFPDIVGPEIISTLSPELFEQIRGGMDTVSEQRSAHGLQVSAIEYVAAQKRREYLSAKALNTFNELDCWLTPTCPFLPMSLADIESGKLHQRGLQASRNTQPGNLLNLCGVSLPMHSNTLPTGLQILMKPNDDKALLETAEAMERCINGVR
jgi:aspartyl-tRNA(Asn)/glutamyl-tRNA(Gln) amidotransferase subunit A